MKNHNTEISDLIFKSLVGDLTIDERRTLNLWLKNPNNQAVFEKICDAENIDEKFEQHSNIDVEADWQLVAQKTTQKKFYGEVLKYAAAILLPIGLFLAVLLSTSMPEYIAEQAPLNLETVEGDQPVLITNDGDEHIIGVQDTILNVDDANVEVGTEDVRYDQKKNEKQDSIRYNVLKTPKGLKYKLTLSDGSVAWLNAETTLKYPVDFTGDVREVFLAEGEVYFDVARDKSKPFIVNFSDHKVKVLGTEFNVKAYEEEENQHVTLVEGSVSIADSAASIVLQPNQQALLNDARKELSVKQVNTDFYTAWKDDLFMYRKEKLGNIIRDLERQYDMKIFYETQKLKEKTFSMRVSKPESFEEVLEYMSATDKVNFEVKDNTVIVKKGTRW
jgi:hypothetical protein